MALHQCLIQRHHPSLLVWPQWKKKDLAEFEQVGSRIFKTRVMLCPVTSSGHLLNYTSTRSRAFWDVNHLILASLPLPLPTIIPRMLHLLCRLPAIFTLCTASLLCAFQKASTMELTGSGKTLYWFIRSLTLFHLLYSTGGAGRSLDPLNTFPNFSRQHCAVLKGTLIKGTKWWQVSRHQFEDLESPESSQTHCWKGKKS